MPRRPTEIAKRNVDAAVADHESHGVRRSSNSSKKDSKGTKSGAAFNRVEERDEEVFVEQMGIRTQAGTQGRKEKASAYASVGRGLGTCSMRQGRH